MRVRTRRVAYLVPRDEWYRLRLLALVAGGCLLFVAVTGVLSVKLFATPTTAKYLATVIAAAMLIVTATLRAPLTTIVCLAVLTAPLGFVFSFEGLQPSPLMAVDLLAVLLALSRSPRSGTWLAKMAPIYGVCLLPGIIGSGNPGYYVVWLVVTLATGWLTYLVALEMPGERAIVMSLVVIAAAEGALAIWEFKSGQQINLYGSALSNKLSASYYFSYGSFFRPDATLPDPIALGQFLCLSLPIAVAFSASLVRQRVALVASVAAGIIALGLLLSLDRASTIGGAAGLLLTLVLLPRSSRFRTLAQVVLVLAIVGLFAFLLAPHTIAERANSIFDPTSAHVVTSRGDLLRLRQWHAAWKTFEDNPVTGVGLGNIQFWLPRFGAEVGSGGQAQSVWLQILAEAGVLGIVSVGGAVLAAVRDLWVGWAAHRTMVAGLAGGLLATVVAWTTDYELRYESVAALFAIVLGLIAANADRSRSTTLGVR